jgi:16S rRNA (uracil1498-N3)-methyltransferase
MGREVQAGAPKHRFFVPPERISGHRVLFSAEQAHQLARVLRLRRGAQVRVFDGIGLVDRVVEVVHLGSAAEGRVVGQTPQASEPLTRLVAYPALVPRDKFESVLQKLVEVGVSAVAPVSTARSLVRQPPDEQRRQRWQAIMREAAEQSGRGIIPALRPTLPLADALCAAVAEGPALLAYEGESTLSLAEALSTLGEPAPAAVSLFVGPEGGYSVEEVAVARSVGVRLVSLGPRVLRTETASPIFAALVLFHFREL